PAWGSRFCSDRPWSLGTGDRRIGTAVGRIGTLGAGPGLFVIRRADESLAADADHRTAGSWYSRDQWAPDLWPRPEGRYLFGKRSRQERGVGNDQPLYRGRRQCDRLDRRAWSRSQRISGEGSDGGRASPLGGRSRHF